MCHLISENHILNKQGPSGPSGHDIKFISYGVPASSGQDVRCLCEHGRKRSTAESVRLTPDPWLTLSSPAISTPSSLFLSSLCAEHDILQSALGNPSHTSTSVPTTLVLGSRGGWCLLPGSAATTDGRWGPHMSPQSSTPQKGTLCAWYPTSELTVKRQSFKEPMRAGASLRAELCYAGELTNNLCWGRSEVTLQLDAHFSKAVCAGYLWDPF